MTNSPPSILITGANGFVGSRICRLFLDKGFRVIAGVRRTSDLTALDGLPVEYRYGDVTQPETLPDMVAAVDFIIHNAGVVKAKRQDTFFKVNEKGTMSLCKAVAEHNPSVKKLIYISSLAAAGPSVDNIPVTEDDDPHPITVYGQSKLAGERAALSFADRFHVMAARPPGIYGPGDREIFSFFEIVNKGIKPLTGNTSRQLQLVHVDDLCRGLFLAVTGMTESGKAYFIAERKPYSMKELVTILSQVSGKRCFPLRIPAPLFRLIAATSEMLFRLVGATPMLTREKANELLASWEISITKAQDAFGFVSQIPFEQGARETFAWYRNKGWLK